MPVTVPPFVQYQAPLVPLRGLWNHAPPEGDKFVSAEVNWGVTVPAGNAVQFALSGNSPVALSQVVALVVDNTRNGSDTSFLFPDSGATLTVPAYAQGTFPVYTNALMFYVSSPSAVAGDTTYFAALNSMPPPVTLQGVLEQEHAGLLTVDGHDVVPHPIVPATVSGTVQMITGALAQLAAGTMSMNLVDGTGAVLWFAAYTSGATPVTTLINVSPLRVRFQRGLTLIVTGSTYAVGQSWLTMNVYYEVP